MCEENITYTELKVSSSEKKPAKHSSHQKKGFPYHIVAVILGMFCFLLLLTTAGLGYMSFHYYSGNKIHCENDSSENITSSEVEEHATLRPIKGKSCDIHPGNWSCCEKSCYYFSKDEKTWDESKKSCQQRSSTLIKIDDEEEQKTIQAQIKFGYWVGLQKKEANNFWVWEDGTRPAWELTFHSSTSTSSSGKKCGRLKSTSIVDVDCDKEFHYICEKNATARLKN